MAHKTSDNCNGYLTRNFKPTLNERPSSECIPRIFNVHFVPLSTINFVILFIPISKCPTIWSESSLHTFIENMSYGLSSTAEKMKFSIKDFFSKCDQIRRKLHFLWSVLHMYMSIILRPGVSNLFYIRGNPLLQH